MQAIPPVAPGDLAHIDQIKAHIDDVITRLLALTLGAHVAHHNDDHVEMSRRANESVDLILSVDHITTLNLITTLVGRLVGEYIEVNGGIEAVVAAINESEDPT